MPTIEQARAWYDAHDPVHGWDHVLRVLRMAEWLARQVGADIEVVRAAALLHDASGAHPQRGKRDGHAEASAEFAREVLEAEGYPAEKVEAVVHCIQAHRYRGQSRPESLEARVLFDADKLDVLGAFGVARTIAYALQAGEPVFAEPSPSFMDRGHGEPDEPHSAYHEFLFKLRHVRDRLHTEPARRLGERRHRILTEFFEQLAAEARGEG